MPKSPDGAPITVLATNQGEPHAIAAGPKGVYFGRGSPALSPKVMLVAKP